MRFSNLLFAVLTLTASVASAADPAAAIAAGRQAINNKQYDAAIRTLQDAVPDAAVMAEPQRTQALAALHFYTAIAFSGAKNDAKTREELEIFFELSPKTNSIDPAKFDATFVKRFNETRAAFDRVASANFDAVYPGFRSFRETEPSQRPLAEWNEGPEMTLLGTSDEKADWRRLQDDAARLAFIEDFWAKRDRSESTPENEYRQDFMHRVAFADQTFVTEKTRGSLTDRGRVFVLLGAPKIIRQGNLTAADGGRVINRQKPIMTGAAEKAERAQEMVLRNRMASQVDSTPIVKGRVERWVYGRDQLPKGFPDDQIVFKFITEEGYGENVLQREPLVVKAMHDAGHFTR